MIRDRRQPFSVLRQFSSQLNDAADQAAATENDCGRRQPMTQTDSALSSGEAAGESSANHCHQMFPLVL